MADKRDSSAWALSRRFRLAPNPVEGKPSPGDRHELAWDGHRVLACRAGTDVRIFSADFREWTKSFSQVCASLNRRDAKSFVLDGFLCALDERAHPSFDSLRHYVKKPTPGARIVFAAWDLLMLDDVDLRKEPLADRAEKLAALLAECKEPLVLSQPLEGSPVAMLESLDAMGVRGLVARAPSATYETAATCIPTSDPVEWERSLSRAARGDERRQGPLPADGITKSDIARYYDEVASRCFSRCAIAPSCASAGPTASTSSRGTSTACRRARRTISAPCGSTAIAAS